MLIDVKKQNPEMFDGYKDQLKNRFFALLCEREEEGKWEQFIDTLFVELMGQALELSSINYWALMGKLASLKYLSWKYYRKTIFECMNIIGNIDK